MPFIPGFAGLPEMSLAAFVLEDKRTLAEREGENNGAQMEYEWNEYDELIATNR